MSRARNALIGFDEIAAEFHVAPARLASIANRRAATGFPAPIGEQMWEREGVELWMSELVGAPRIAQVLELKRAITVYTYAAKPGYFPEPDETEKTPAGRERKRWRLERILAWDADRPGRGNPEPRRPREVPDAVGQVDTSQETLTSSEAAQLLGYRNVSSFTSVYAQGKLSGIGEPVAAPADDARPVQGRRWDTRLVLQEAERRKAQDSGHRARLQACLEAVRAVEGGTVSVVELQRQDRAGGTLAEWKSAMSQARRQWKAN